MEELRHHYRVIDMMLTMHSALRDRYQRRALLVDLVLLCSSVILCAAVFIDPDVVKSLNIDPQMSRIAIGICSILVFLISVMELRVDWKEKAERHSQANEALGRLKAECRELLKSEDQPDSQRIKEQCHACAWVLNSLPKIPEAEFHRLKALHKRKIELSKMIGTYPGSSLFMLRLILWFRATRDLLRAQMVSNREGEE